MSTSVVELSALLDSVSKLPERADDLTSEVITKTFVEISQFQGLHKDSHQIVYGRRGTGKTHILRAVEGQLQERYGELGIIPVYLSCREFDLGHSANSLPVERLITVFLRRFVTAVVRRVSEVIEQESKVRWSGLVPSDARRRVSRMKEIQARIAKNLTVGDIELFSEQGERVVGRRKTQVSRSEIGIQLEAVIGQQLGLGGGVNLGHARQNESAMEDFSTLVYKSLGLFNARDLTDNLTELLRLTNGRAIYVLLDEWMWLDLSVQPFFAEFLRTFVTPSQIMFLKIACVPFLTEMSKPRGRQYIGLQEGADIFVDVDLDELFNVDLNTQGVLNVLLAILYRHLATINPQDEAASYEVFVEQLKELVFEDDDTLGELAVASSGNVRDFLVLARELIQQWLLRSGGEAGTSRISRADVRRAALSVYEREKKGSYARAPQGAGLDVLEAIVDRCHSNGDRAFLLSSEVSRHEQVMKLYHDKLINLLYRGLRLRVNGESKNFDLYAVDFGSFASALLTDTEGRFVSFINSSNGGVLSLLSITDAAISVVGSIFRRQKFILSKDAGVDLERVARDLRKYVFDPVVQPKLSG